MFIGLASDCGPLTTLCRAAPGLLERPGWSNEDGNPVALGRAPSEARHLGWELAVSTATSPDGWQYASVFKCGQSNPHSPYAMPCEIACSCAHASSHRQQQAAHPPAWAGGAHAPCLRSVSSTTPLCMQALRLHAARRPGLRTRNRPRAPPLLAAQSGALGAAVGSGGRRRWSPWHVRLGAHATLSCDLRRAFMGQRGRASVCGIAWPGRQHAAQAHRPCFRRTRKHKCSFVSTPPV